MKTLHQSSSSPATRRDESGFEQLLAVCQPLSFEPHDIAARISRQGLYHEDMEREFSLLIKLFHYTSRRHTPSVTWHERVELFTPLDGQVRMRYGGTEVRLEPGDTLIVESLKPHGILDFAGFDTRVVVITFMPDFVFSLGSPSDDFALLLPFYTWGESHPKVLHRSETVTEAVHEAMGRLLPCYFDRRAPMPLRRIGCKAVLCGLLFHTAQRFGSSAVLQTEILRQQERSQRLKPLFEHISHHYAERFSLGSAARLVGMSRPTFMRTFKRVAGMTLVDYMHHVRLSHGLRLLKETELTIAEIADRIGYADQSYFDRRFREAFLQSPRQFREAVVASGAFAPE